LPIDVGIFLAFRYFHESMKRKYLAALFLVPILVFVVLWIGLILSANPVTRITFIDLKAVFPNLYDHNEGRTSSVFSAGPYPSNSSIEYFFFRTTRGSIGVACCLEDLNSWIESRKTFMTGPPSRPIGDDAFFKNETPSNPETLDLAYRRYNLGVCFRDNPRREYRNGRPVITDEDKTELEQAAQALDAAIQKGNPGIKIEVIGRYGIAAHKMKRFVGGIAWLLYALFHPNGRMWTAQPGSGGPTYL
jgi:hypothetical protein